MIGLKVVAAATMLAFSVPSFVLAIDIPDTAAIEKITGMKGKLNEKEGVFKVQLPRKDISATVLGAKMVSAMGLTCWAAFKKAGESTMVMGDIVLLEDQIDAVMDAALNNGLEVTALHNHFTFDNPRIMFMHIGGMGKEEDLAGAVQKVFAAIKATAGGMGKVTRTAINAKGSQVTPQKLEAILGKGEFKDGIFKVTIGRTTRMHGHEAGKEMGVNTWAAFAGTDRQAVTDGDFAMLETELQDVLKALRRAGISIVAIHNHMTGEEPRIMFLHFWGTGKAETLANGVKSALAKTAAGEQ